MRIMLRRESQEEREAVQAHWGGDEMRGDETRRQERTGHEMRQCRGGADGPNLRSSNPQPVIFSLYCVVEAKQMR